VRLAALREISPADAIPLFQEALAIARDPAVQDHRFAMYWLEDLQQLHWFLGESEAAIHCLREALTAARTIGHCPKQAGILFELFRKARELGRFDEAMAFLEEAVPILVKIGERKAAHDALSALASGYCEQGHPEKALPWFESALAFSREFGNKDDECYLLNGLGIAHYCRRDFHKAIESYEASLAIARASANKEAEAVALYNIGDCWHQLGDLARAEPLYQGSLALDMPSTSYICAYGLACISFSQKADQEASKRMAECERLCRKLLETTPNANKPAFLIALSRLAAGETGQGIEACREALRTHYTPYDASMALCDLAALRQAAPDIKGLERMEQILREALQKESAACAHTSEPCPN
jgi:tetratricopeptide (TPR) repeat protein